MALFLQLSCAHIQILTIQYKTVLKTWRSDGGVVGEGRMEKQQRCQVPIHGWWQDVDGERRGRDPNYE
jgi:hypothetical protein